LHHFVFFGIGVGTGIIRGHALLADLAPKGKRGSTMGIAAGTNWLGQAIGPSIMGLILIVGSFKTIVIISAFCLIFMLLVINYMLKHATRTG
jgi:MFS family permease